VRRKVIVSTIGGGSLLLLAWLTAWLLVGNQVPRHTEVLGVEIGSHSTADAVSILQTRFSSRLAKPINFESVGKIHQVAPEDLGATFDMSATVAGAKHRPINPLSLIARIFSVAHLQPVIRVDQSRFENMIDDLAKRSEKSVIEGSIAYNGLAPVPIWPVGGAVVDRAGALAAFESQWLRADVIVLPIIREQARVEVSEVARVLQSVAFPAVSAPVTLVVDGQDLVVSPKAIANALTFSPDAQGDLLPHFSSSQLSQSLGTAWSQLMPPARDAVIKFISDELHIYPSSMGKTISDEALTQALAPILAVRGSDRRAVVFTSDLPPRISTQDVNSLGITGPIDRYTTYFPPAAYRIQNIHRAADLIDGTVVQPGGVFSLNQTVGERTAANGFAEGIVIYNGRFAKDFGGSVSQVATTIWNAAWFSGVKLVAHMAHSFYISRYPVGRESTVAWPNIDVRFRNDTGHALLVHATYTNSSLTISIYGTRKYEVDTITGPRTKVMPFAVFSDDSVNCISQGGVVGFDIDVTRILKRSGVEVQRQVFHTHYTPEDRVTCTNPLSGL